MPNDTPYIATRYRRVLVPVDGSGRASWAVPYAQLVARAFGAEVTLLQVVDDENQEKAAIAQLEEHRDLLQKAGLVVSAERGDGDPAEAIAEAANRSPGTPVTLMPKAPVFSQWLHGSVSDRVIQHVQSTLAVRVANATMPETTGTFRTIILPLDGSPKAEAAISHTVGMANAFGAQVLVVRSIRAPNILIAEHRASQSRDPDPGRIKAQQYLEGIAGRLRASGVSDVEVTVSHHDPGSMITFACQRVERPVIVMSTRGHGAVAKAFLGSVAQKVLSHGARPVLMVRP